MHQHPAGGVPPEEIADEGNDHEESLGRGSERQPGQPLDERCHQVGWQVPGDRGQEGAACYSLPGEPAASATLTAQQIRDQGTHQAFFSFFL